MEYGQQGQHGHGNTGRVDQYGNPVGGVGHGTGTGTGGMGYGGTAGTGGMGQLGEHGGAGMGGGQFQPVREEHKTGGILHRSGSSSSSSVTTCIFTMLGCSQLNRMDRTDVGIAYYLDPFFCDL